VQSAGVEGAGGADAGVVQWLRWWRLPVASAPRRSDRGYGQWSSGGCGEPYTLATDPHLLFMALRDGGPPASHWAGRSRSERESKAQLAVGPTGGDQPNILPLDLIFTFNFIPFTSFLISSQINA